MAEIKPPARRRHNEVGPTGQQLAENLKRIRAARGLSTSQVSRGLAELGRPIQPSGITKIESCDRSVDVDDLLALAVLLRVNPSALLFPSVAEVDASYGVTAAGERFTTTEVWDWADGLKPLRRTEGVLDDMEAEAEAEADFQTVARPKGRRFRKG